MILEQQDFRTAKSGELWLLCLICFFLKEWDSIVCIRLPVNITINLRVSSLFEQMLFNNKYPFMWLSSYIVSYIITCPFVGCLNLKMNTLCFSETSVMICRSTQRKVPDYVIFFINILVRI